MPAFATLRGPGGGQHPQVKSSQQIVFKIVLCSNKNGDELHDVPVDVMTGSRVKGAKEVREPIKVNKNGQNTGH